MYFKFSLYSHFIPRMIIRVILVPWHRFQYSNICSSMMSIHPEGGGSMWDTRVSLINVDMVSGLIKYCLMLPFSTVCRGRLWVVIALFCAIEILHVRIGGRRSIKYRDNIDSLICQS